MNINLHHTGDLSASALNINVAIVTTDHPFYSMAVVNIVQRHVGR